VLLAAARQGCAQLLVNDAAFDITVFARPGEAIGSAPQPVVTTDDPPPAFCKQKAGEAALYLGAGPGRWARFVQG